MLISSRPLEIAATLVAAGGLVCAVARAVGFDSLLNWGSLSALGLVLVFAAALIERRRGWLIARLLSATGLGDDGDSHAGPHPAPGAALSSRAAVAHTAVPTGAA
jgi:hypothetical protein